MKLISVLSNPSRASVTKFVSNFMLILQIVASSRLVVIMLNQIPEFSNPTNKFTNCLLCRKVK